jgi:hypothetical protein
LDVAQVRDAIAQRRRHADGADVEAGGVVVVGRRVVPAGGERGRHPCVADILDVRIPGLQAFDAQLVGVEPNDGESGFHRPYG